MADDPAARSPCLGDGDRSGWRDRDPAVVISTAIAEREGVAATDLPPLFESVDPDALDRLVRASPDAQVRFTHHGYAVVVSGSGEVTVTRSGRSATASR